MCISHDPLHLITSLLCDVQTCLPSGWPSPSPLCLSRLIDKSVSLIDEILISKCEPAFSYLPAYHNESELAKCMLMRLKEIRYVYHSEM